MIPALDPDSGFLPRGRYACTEKEIRERFVDHEDFVTSATRPEVWSHWEAARDFVIARIPVYRVWFAGSFMTSKPDPDDLDITWVWDAVAFDALSPSERAVMLQFAVGRDGLSRYGLRIDSYAVPWRCHPAPDGATIALDPYFQLRGYWDDWWMRTRTGPKHEPPKTEDAYPRRGYLEVTVREHG